MADPSLVPSPVNDPGFRSITPAIRVGMAALAGGIVLTGLWAWSGTHQSDANAPVPPPLHSAAPAVDPDSLDSVIADRRPPPPAVVAHASAMVVTQQPLPETPAPAATYAAPPAPQPAAPVAQVVPRVLTSAELSSSKMTIDTPPAPEAPAAQGKTAESASPPARPISASAHSSFFAEQASSQVGYDAEDASCIVRATTAIQARLVTHVDSELPGGVVKAQVVTPVDCADGDQAIPAGATLQGTYDSGTASGESRLLVVFSRVIFPPSSGHPNGRAYEIAMQSATDAMGGTGLSGRVNTHAGRMLGQALVYTLLGAAGEAIGRSTSAGSIIVRGGGGGNGSVAGQFAGGAQAAKPTIYANAGDPVDVVLSRDLPMEAIR